MGVLVHAWCTLGASVMHGREGTMATAEDYAGASVWVRVRPNGRRQLVMQIKEGGRWRRLTRMLPASADTDAKAKRAISRWREELIRTAEEQPEPSSGNETPTVGEWLHDWYERSLMGSRSVRESTLRGYRSDIGRATESLGDVRLGDLTRADVQSWVNSMNETLSPSTVRKSLSTLSRAMRNAAMDGVVASNPCDGVSIPRMERHQKNSLSASQFASLSRALSLMEPTPIVVGAAMALHTGMREGEVCAIRWRDVDMENDTITISHGITASEHGTELGETKRPASDRTIPIGSVLHDVLARRLSCARRRAAGCRLSEHAKEQMFVLGDVDGHYYEPDRLGRGWHQLAASLGLVGLAGRAPTFHDLRHTYATVAIAGGADVMAVASYLGHADPHVTLREYANADPAAKRRTASIMDLMASRTD